MSIVEIVGVIFRSIQRWIGRDFRGQYRMVKLFSRYLPSYHGEVILNDGLKIHVNTARSGIEEWLFYTGTHQKSLTDFLRVNINENCHCIDIGAHLGFYTLKFAKWVGSGGKVAAFEPNPTTHNELLDNIRRNGIENVMVVGDAVAEESGVASFFVTTPGMSSLHISRSNKQNEIKVNVTTIDSFMQNSEWERLDIIKIDTEGFDCHVILGARESIIHFKPLIVFEYSLDCDREKCRKSIRLLNSIDYLYLNLKNKHSKSNISIDELNSWLPDRIGHIDVICLPASK